MSVSATSLSSHTWLRLSLGGGVTERLLDIVSDTAKTAQQRLSEATAFAGTAGWDACAMFALAPDLIRHVQLRCTAQPHEQLILQILDSEDGQERLQVCYVSPDGEEWERTL